MATMRTCHVTKVIIPIIAISSTPAATTKIIAKGMSKSRTLKSDDACKIGMLRSMIVSLQVKYS